MSHGAANRPTNQSGFPSNHLESNLIFLPPRNYPHSVNVFTCALKNALVASLCFCFLSPIFFPFCSTRARFASVGSIIDLINHSQSQTIFFFLFSFFFFFNRLDVKEIRVVLILYFEDNWSYLNFWNFAALQYYLKIF